MTLYEAALAFATLKHAGQLRRDGKPYITHPEAVAEIIRKRLRTAKLTHEDLWIVLTTVAILHDVLEDCDVTEKELEVYLRPHTTKKILGRVMDALRLLNKPKGGSYAEYIFEIAKEIVAIEAKLADLEHNLSDLEPGKLRDKYLLARAYLELRKRDIENNGSKRCRRCYTFVCRDAGVCDCARIDYYNEKTKKKIIPVPPEGYNPFTNEIEIV